MKQRLHIDRRQGDWTVVLQSETGELQPIRHRVTALEGGQGVRLEFEEPVLLAAGDMIQIYEVG